MTATFESTPRSRTEVPDLPALEQGDCLTRDEFERRYHRMPRVKKAELIEGIVHMPSPVRANQHAGPHAHLGTVVGFYEAETTGVRHFNNSSVRLDLENEPQPDVVLIIVPEKGGQARISDDDYIEGAPELCIEISGSTVSYDLNQKKRTFLRNGVREYLVWLTRDRRLILWELRDGEFQEIPADADGILKSRVFPGLWFDSAALLEGKLKPALATLQKGLASEEHAAFAAALAAK
jgi:Uma2 family endonuclease